MKKVSFVILLVLAVTFVLFSVVQSQPRRDGYGIGPGYGYGMGPGMMRGWDWVNVPDKLPAPKNTEWLQKLREILTLEKQSLAQYQADQEKYNIYMPYMMVIPQEEDHIQWIQQLFNAYGLPSDGKVPPVIQTGTVQQAYEIGIKTETDLLPRYEWLAKNSDDQNSKQVLNTILFQSQWHLAMFDNATRMGQQNYGFWGFGRRGWGMMHGYGYGTGPGMMGYYGLGYMGIFMWIIFFIIVGVLFYIIVKATKMKGQIQHESPLDILKKRYAKGEITGQEYEKMKKDLEG